MGDIINLVEILEEKERQKKLQEDYEDEELRAQLRWVLAKIHQKNITYDKEAEYDDNESSLSGGWFSKLFRRKKDNPDD
jgi:hypothetical protein